MAPHAWLVQKRYFFSPLAKSTHLTNCSEVHVRLNNCFGDHKRINNEFLIFQHRTDPVIDTSRNVHVFTRNVMEFKGNAEGIWHKQPANQPFQALNIP